jgi:hypothetical protein
MPSVLAEREDAVGSRADHAIAVTALCEERRRRLRLMLRDGPEGQTKLPGFRRIRLGADKRAQTPRPPAGPVNVRLCRRSGG